MDTHLNRIHHFKGHPRAIGFAVGRALGPRLEQTISHYLAGLESSSDMEKLHEGALPWLRGLPQRFQEEFEGLAENDKAELVYKVQRRAPDTGWTTVRLGAKTRNANFPSLAMLNGRPAVAYTHDAQGVLFAYDSGRPNSGFWPAVSIGREGVTGTGTPSLAQVAGRPAVVYADGVGIRFVRAR